MARRSINEPLHAIYLYRIISMRADIQYARHLVSSLFLPAFDGFPGLHLALTAAHLSVAARLVPVL